MSCQLGNRTQGPFAGSLCFLPSSRLLLFSSVQWGCLVLIWVFLARPFEAWCPCKAMRVGCSLLVSWVWKSFNYWTHHGNHGNTGRIPGTLTNYDCVWCYHISNYILMKKVSLEFQELLCKRLRLSFYSFISVWSMQRDWEPNFLKKHSKW